MKDLRVTKEIEYKGNLITFDIYLVDNSFEYELGSIKGIEKSYELESGDLKIINSNTNVDITGLMTEDELSDAEGLVGDYISNNYDELISELKSL